MQLDAVGGERLGERLAERRGLAGEQALRALDDRDRGAHARERLAELEPDGSAAEHEQPARDLGQPGRLAVGPHAVEPRQAGDRRDDRRPTRWRCTTWRAV